MTIEVVGLLLIMAVWKTIVMVEVSEERLGCWWTRQQLKGLNKTSNENSSGIVLTKRREIRRQGMSVQRLSE